MRYPGDSDEVDALTALPGGELVEILANQITELAGNGDKPVEAIGVAVPGVVRHGVVEDAPNLTQIKGMRMAEELARVLVGPRHQRARSHCQRCRRDRRGRRRQARPAGPPDPRWTIGNGIGYGRWPYVEGVWEGGHITVTLDPKERFCGCGGVGHLEGIMGYRAMRLRFLDREPEEVFAHAKEGDAALPRIRRPVASRAGCGNGIVHPPRRAGTLLLHRPQCGFPRCAAAARPPRNHGEDEPAAELLARSAAQ